MAKGNPFLGYARGKVGDIVLSRLDGEQVAKARNRHPRQPDTERQLWQKAIMATVTRMYQAGREIFDHSFQGRSVPAGSMARFLSVNAKRLRTALAADVANGGTPTAFVNAPGTLMPVPNSYVVSEGTLPVGDIWNTEYFSVLFNDDNVTINTTVKEWADARGISTGDIFTLIFMRGDNRQVIFTVNGGSGVYSKQCVTKLQWIRFTTKDLSVIENDVVLDKNFDDIFEVTASEGADISIFSTASIDAEISAEEIWNDEDWDVKGMAIIRSRLDTGERSNSVMLLNAPTYFIAYPYALQAWQQGSADLGDSELVLEGGGPTLASPAAPSTDPAVTLIMFGNVRMPLGLNQQYTAPSSIQNPWTESLYIEGVNLNDDSIVVTDGNGVEHETIIDETDDNNVTFPDIEWPIGETITIELNGNYIWSCILED